jgi:predicted kinase
MPDGFFESWLDAIEKGTPPQTFLVRYFHPDVNKQIGPDGQAGINPNEMFINIDGETKTVADLNSIGSDVFTSNQLKYPNVISLQQKLLYDIGLNKITKNEAAKTAKRYADKLANQQQNANNETGELINNSGVVFYSKKMDMNSVLSKATTLDNALANARKLDAPVKKIRVFDFDDTLAETKSLVFYNKPSDTKTVKPKLKAIVMAGPPGGGKSSIIKGLGLVKDGFKEVNQDISLEWLKTKEGLPAKESDYTKEQKSIRSKLGAQARKIAARKLDKFSKQGDGIILDGTGASVAATEAKIQALEELGYEVSMIYVNTPKETAIARNQARKERSLPDFVVEKTWDAVNANRDVYAGRFGDKFYEVNTEGLKQSEVPQEVSDAIRNDLAAEERGRLTAEEFAKQGKDLVDQGFVMDFSDFNIVREGERGPLFDVAKKIRDARGNEDLFVLTARAPESADAIYEFLKSEGLEFKKENIVGLGNSTGAAKANWVVDKAAEGYNDFYFADDAYANVQAVQDALDQIDVKSKVQQAKVKFSKSIDKDFNKIIEQTTGIASEKRYSKAKAKVRGAGKGNKKFFIPYSAEDFMGLIYPLLSKGTLGDSQMAWFKEHLLDPYGRAIENLSSDRIQMMQDFKELKKSLEVPKDLRKKTESGFTNEQAVRVYLFNKVGHEVPGLSETDLKELIDIVNSDGKLKAFADQILSVTKGDGYVKPAQEWLAGTITTDLIDLLNTTKRKKYLEQSGYLENANEIFSQENLNKLEAAYGAKYREAVENVLARMKSGKNRMFSGSRLSNRVLDYINGSIGTIMFFNTRSAVLQTISAVNFLNWSFNNPIKAGKAFANQSQYWKDFKTLMNSDYLTDRRNGLKLNISENEIANAAATAKNKARGAMNYILQKGYLPTQFADSFAIASGGATFYRNRINDLVKQGMEVKQAEEQALSEWKETAEISQQSSDPSKISQQQASDLGRVILAFANTPMQYARIQKRAIQDLVNKRGDAKTNVSKIIYYGVVQNLIFNALQQALFGLGFGDDEDDEKKEKQYLNTANGMLDSTLRGLGIAGATTAVIKNFLLDVYERSGRKRPEYVDAVYKLLALSPPISSKISKVRQAAYQFDSKKRRQEIFEKGFSIDNPAYEAGAKVISATTNLPLDRVFNKINNIEAALGEDPEVWQRIAMLAGWPEWQIMAKQKTKSELPRFSGSKIRSPKPYKRKTIKRKTIKRKSLR